MSNAYFRALEEFDWALAERRLPQAHLALKAGLRASKREITQNRREGYNHSSYFLGSAAGVVAALVNDPEVFGLMDRVASFVGGDEPLIVEQYRTDATAVERVRNSLQLESELSLDALKEAADPNVRGRLSRLLSWMEKHSELSVIKTGKTTIIKLGQAPRVPNIITTTFREGQPLAAPVIRPLPPVLESNKTLLPIEGSDDPIEAKVFSPEMKRLPRPDRLPGTMQTHVLRDGFWLIGHPRSLPNGGGETKVMVKSKSGETLKTFVLRHRVVRAFSNLNREYIVVLDAMLTVVVFDLLGNYVNEFSLANNPEVRSVTDAYPDTKPSAMLRAVDVSSISGDIAFSVLDYVWRFTSDGKPITALRVADGYSDEALPQIESGGDTSDSGSELVVLDFSLATIERDNAMSSTIDHDWVYFLRFSDQHDSLFIANYSGELITVPRNGEYERRWNMQSSVDDLLETDDGFIVAGWAGLFYIRRDGTIEQLPEGGIFYSESQLVGYGGIYNPVSRAGVSYDRDIGIRGMYPHDGKLRIETKTMYFDLEFP